MWRHICSGIYGCGWLRAPASAVHLPERGLLLCALCGRGGEDEGPERREPHRVQRHERDCPY